MTPGRRRLLLVGMLLFAAAAAPLAQGRAGGAAPAPPGAPQNPNIAPTEAGTSAISGIVIDGATKAPIANAVVYLGPPQHGPPGSPLRQLTDQKGRYLFRDLPAFSGYFVQAAKPGYSNGYYGRGSSGALGGRIAVREGQWFADGHITMWRPGAISGRVVDHNGEPVVDVFVRVLPRITVSGRSQLAAGNMTTTDDRGMYRIAGLAAGQYIVQVPSVQSAVPASATLSEPAATSDDAAIAAARDPMMDAGGGMRLQIGRYLPPLLPIGGRSAAYPPTFYPATMVVADASVIDLKNSEERTNVDIQLRPVPTFTISGTVQGPSEEVANLTLRLLPLGLDELGEGSETATTLVAGDGTFAFLNVPAGGYSLEARRTITQFTVRTSIPSRQLPNPPEPVDPARGSGGGSSGVLAAPAGTMMTFRGLSAAYGARMRVAVEDRDVRDVVVTLKRAATMTGRFVWEDAATPPAGSLAPLVRLLPAGGQASLGQPRTIRTLSGPGAARAPASDQFVVEGLLQGEYVLNVLSGGRVKSIAWNGRDYSYRPFDASSGEDIADVVVTLTTKNILFTGTVQDERGATSDDAAVIVFPVERDQWSNYGFAPERLKAIQVTNEGGYRFQSLPAGEYLAVAVHPDLIDGWKDPVFLEKASRVATRVTLVWGENKTQDLRVVNIR